MKSIIAMQMGFKLKGFNTGFTKQTKIPRASVILLDWSCRESFHSLFYLNRQTVPRNEYEIIWIEYYSRHAPKIKERIEEYKKTGKPPFIDKWLIMGMPENLYYHKHLMYNVGIIASTGNILVFCDSDAIFADSFIENVIRQFEEDKNVVLHLDQVRNNNRTFYPFNYPGIEEVLGPGCINWEDGRTTGLIDNKDPLHTRNYGACMCALREDLIAIGGADEHINYLGHICGPYEMTFRLMNYGKREVWHEKEFLYHVWHPGTNGRKNYLGPHDGRNMSREALEILKTGRIMSLCENPSIKLMRVTGLEKNKEDLIMNAINRNLDEWSIERLRSNRRKHNFNFLFLMLFIKQVIYKGLIFMRRPGSWKRLPSVLFGMFNVFNSISMSTSDIFQRCQKCLDILIQRSVKDVAIYGVNQDATAFCKFIENKIGVAGVYEDDIVESEPATFWEGHLVMSICNASNYNGYIVVTKLVNSNDIFRKLRNLGIEENRIVLL